MIQGRKLVFQLTQKSWMMRGDMTSGNVGNNAMVNTVGQNDVSQESKRVRSVAVVRMLQIADGRISVIEHLQVPARFGYVGVEAIGGVVILIATKFLFQNDALASSVLDHVGYFWYLDEADLHRGLTDWC